MVYTKSVNVAGMREKPAAVSTGKT
jgi:hypothetical protein